VVGNADERLASPGAGREPAASALIGWLTDAEAPHLCVVTGPSGAGKSHLLAWLVRHGRTGDSAAGERRVHAVAPLAGVSLRSGALRQLRKPVDRDFRGYRSRLVDLNGSTSEHKSGFHQSTWS
jgi:hypothetical protein